MYSNGYTGTDSDHGDANGICGNAEHSDNGIHIFADNRRIIIHGKDGNNNTVLLMNGEFTENDTTTRYSLVPQAQICLANMYHSTLTIMLVIEETLMQFGTNKRILGLGLVFASLCIHIAQGWTGKIRFTGWHHYNNRDNYEGKHRRISRLDDGTQYGSNTNETTYGFGKPMLLMK